jgi:F-type H+-transporting ATPase subunit b
MTFRQFNGARNITASVCGRTINGPNKLNEVPNPVRWYCVPESWFKFFYEKTGVTGPYMFFYGLLVYGFSKEYIVLWYDFTEYLILAASAMIVVKK